jgi:hypothetical protein
MFSPLPDVLATETLAGSEQTYFESWVQPVSQQYCPTRFGDLSTGRSDKFKVFWTGVYYACSIDPDTQLCRCIPARMLHVETDTMLNQFIQIRIQIRDAGHAAIGCLIDGLVDVVDGLLGHTPQPINRYLLLEQLRLGRGTSEWVWRLGRQGQLRRLQGGYLPRTGELWLQG